MNLLNRLIEQAKNPSGFVGSVMLTIMNRAHDGLSRWGLGFLKGKDAPEILDIGCGGGKTLQLLSQLHSSSKIYGVDFSPQAVEDSIKVNKRDVETGKMMVQQASVSSLPFQDNTFNLITAVQTHYFWPDLENDVKEVYRAMKEGGHFFILSEVYKIQYHMKKYKTKEEMKNLFKNTGFGSIHIHEHPSKKWICIIGEK